MKANKLLVAALPLAVFFLAQSGSELSFLLGPEPGIGKKFREPALGLKALSLSSRLYTQSAFSWLEAGQNAANDAAVKASMRLLGRALRLNPLDYQARYYLAKAYLRFSAVNNDYFDLGVRELKRAAFIRGSNKQIALDCSRVFFSLWPLLEKSDQRFAASLLSGVMPELSWPEFSPLVEMWALYVQEVPLLMDLLRLKPEFFGPAADQLVSSGIPMEKRRELLALHEVNALDAMERRYNEIGLRGEISLADARSLLGQVRGIKGYYRLNPGSGFAPEKLAKLQRELLLEVISGLLDDAKAQADPQTAPRLRELIQFYIAEHPGLNELDELQKLLEDRKYFKENDFSSLRLKTLIALKKGDYNGVIAEIEALRQGISFVRKEQVADYTDILLMLIDSYYSTKLLTAAEAVAAELYKEQPENPDIQYRVLRIRNILGSEGPQDPVLSEKLLAVRNSRFLQATRSSESFAVYLFNQPWIEIVLDPALLAALKPGQIVQVFVDGRIAFESYVGGLPPKIAIGPPFTVVESKAGVQVIVK